MRQKILLLCAILGAFLTVGSLQAAELEEPSCAATIAQTGTAAAPTLDLFGPEPMPQAGCRISCNTDFNIYCTGSTYSSCHDGVDSGDLYIQCDDNRYYCPPCPSWDPYHCID